MATPSTEINEREQLRVVDPDLPFLASRAAIELDNLLLGRSKTLISVIALATRLRNSFRLDANGGSPRSLVDPATLTVLGEAINRSTVHPPLTSVEDLIKKACAIADDLTKKTDPKDDRESLIWARAFCVALSHLASAYHKSIFDLRPPHPFRRIM